MTFEEIKKNKEVCELIRNNWVDDLHDRYMQQEDGFGKDLRYSVISCKKELYTVMEKLMYERVDVGYRTKVEFKGNQYI